MPRLNRRTWLRASTGAALGGTLALASCGFRPRGAPEFAFRSLFIAAPAQSPLAQELQRTLESAGSGLLLLRDSAQRMQAEAVLDLMTERHERVVVAFNSAGQVRELQLRLRVGFRLYAPRAEQNLIDPTELLQTRDVSYNETQALAKEAEEALLFRNMQTDVVQQLVRRLAAVRPNPSH